jgi:hypothetical protein
MGNDLTLKDNLVLPAEVLEIVNKAVADIQKELTKADRVEYHLDGVKMSYIYGGFDLTFRIRHDKFGVANEVLL